MLALKNVSLKKGKKIVLKDVSLDIPLGRTTLLLGKSGSGKTSLLRCMAQLEKGYAGEVAYKDERLEGMPAKRRAQTLGFVPQSYALFPHMNVLENCAEPLALVTACTRQEARNEAEKTLADLGMQPYLGARISELSGGQQQRVAIARALLFKPAFLLFDEPTSALDPENTELFIQIVKQLVREEKGIVVSSQDMGFAKSLLDRVCFLEEGVLLEDFTKEEIPSGSRIRQFIQE